MKKILQKLFSIKNDGIYKVVTLFGLTIKFKDKRNILMIQAQPQWQLWHATLKSIESAPSLSSLLPLA